MCFVQDNYVCEDGKCHGCLSDDDCDSDEYCDNGACKLGCRDDSGKKMNNLIDFSFTTLFYNFYTFIQFNRLRCDGMLNL